jgi:type IV secretory pathway component VirB8
MKDKADMRLERLFAIAREERIDTNSAEEYFETRLLARVRELREAPPWYAVAWRMVPLFTVLAAVMAISAISFNPSRKSDMFAAITSSQEMTLAGSYLAGE